MSRPTLYGLHYSPWTQRAKWALDHHGVSYRYREHVPFLGEPVLRFVARRTGRKATVPLFVDGARSLGDSIEIMQHADAIGRGASLRAAEPEVAAWASRVEPMLAAMRKRVTYRTLQDSEALREAASAVTPDFAAGLFRPVAVLGARFLARKYGFQPEGGDHDAAIEAGLKEIRLALGEGPYIEEGFTAADVLVATALQGVRPHDSARLKPATCRVWSHEGLAASYADLLEWRDGIYARHASS